MLTSEALVRKYLEATGYRLPPNKLFQTELHVQPKTKLVKPEIRKEDPYPAAETPHGEQHAESKLPGADTQNNSDARMPQPPGEYREKEVEDPESPVVPVVDNQCYILSSR